jgi:hypothetical protein
VDLPFRLIGSPESAGLSIAQKGYAELAWQLGPNDTAILSPGSYRLRAVLAVSGSPGWNGTVSSADIALRIVDEPTELDEARFTEKMLLLARFEKNRLNPAGAEAALADLLKAYPDSVEGNATLAAWREADGRYAEAYQAIVKATDAYAKQEHKAAEPPFSLLELRRRLVQRLLGTQ